MSKEVDNHMDELQEKLLKRAMAVYSHERLAKIVLDAMERGYLRECCAECGFPSIFGCGCKNRKLILKWSTELFKEGKMAMVKKGKGGEVVETGILEKDEQTGEIKTVPTAVAKEGEDEDEAKKPGWEKPGH